MHTKTVKSILSSTNGMNLYRGCTHGCIYCDARSKCYHIEHEFTDIEVKENAPILLEEKLKSKREKCMIGTGSMSDPYNHYEEKLGLTRKCLEIIERYGYGICIQTKSRRILRDIDIIDRINKKAKSVVEVTLTTYDEELCKIVEPNVSTTKERVEILKECKRRGIPTVVWFTPILPYINDTKENMLGILNYCIENNVYGILYFNAGVTLREGDREYYYQMLDKYFPGLKNRYIKEYGNSYEVISKNTDELDKLFFKVCKENNIVCDCNEIFKYMRKFDDKYEQLNLF